MNLNFTTSPNSGFYFNPVPQLRVGLRYVKHLRKVDRQRRDKAYIRGTDSECLQWEVCVWVVLMVWNASDHGCKPSSSLQFEACRWWSLLQRHLLLMVTNWPSYSRLISVTADMAIFSCLLFLRFSPSRIFFSGVVRNMLLILFTFSSNNSC
jgi:hypothetical protein